MAASGGAARAAAGVGEPGVLDCISRARGGHAASSRRCCCRASCCGPSARRAVRRELNPSIGYGASVTARARGGGLAFAVATRLPHAARSARCRCCVPVSLASLMMGFDRAHHAPQGAVAGDRLPDARERRLRVRADAVSGLPLLVEMGVLLDVFVGVFIMGLVVFQINRELESLDSRRLTRAARLMLPARARAGAGRRCGSPPTSIRRAAAGGLAGRPSRCTCRARGLRRGAGPAPELSGWLAFDPLGGLVLTLVSVVFARGGVLHRRLSAARGSARRPGRSRSVCSAFLAWPPRWSRSRDHFGLLWVGHGGDHAGDRAAHLRPARSPLARGGVEVPAGLLGGHRAGAARHVLPRHSPGRECRCRTAGR